jgi:putative ABC transport system ATP-binding protein
MADIIKAEKLKFRYSTSVRDVLSIPEFSIQEGEKVFLFGPSGSGKSTMLELLSGILLPSSGMLKLVGQDLSKLSNTQRDQFRAKNIGYIFQSFNLVPYLTAEENILLPLQLQGLKVNDADVKSLAQQLGIQEILNRRSLEISVGQQQRVAAARALISKPRILLADEPTSALDADHRERFIQLLFQLAEKSKTTVVFVSHDKLLEKLFEKRISIQELNRNF